MKTFNQESAVELLAELITKLPDIQGYSGNGVHVPEFVSALARKWPAPLDLQDEKGLEALSRKIDILKKVWTIYDAEWGKPIVREPLTTPYFLLLIAVEIAYSVPTQYPLVDAKGIRLRRINTALNALDLSKDCGFTDDRNKLKACAHNLIEVVLNQ